MTLIGLDASEPVGLEFVGHRHAEPVLALLRAEAAEFEAVLGAPVAFVADASRYACRWIIRDEPGPQLSWDAATSTITSTAASESEFRVTLNLLHTLAWSDRTTVSDEPEPTRAAIVDRVEREVANTFPSFEVRGLDWPRIVAKHSAARTAEGDAFVIAAQSWIAELGDAHTAIRRTRPVHNPPYRARMTHTGALLTDVPEFSAAWAAGVRPGWILEVDDPQLWLTITGATPQQHEQVAARRFLAITGGWREFTARDQRGSSASWIETSRPLTLTETVEHTRLDDGRRLVRLRHFDGSLDIDAAFTEIFAAARDSDELVLDLRGNVGGSLAAATRLRDRFLREITHLGTIRFTTGTAALGPSTPLTGHPSELPRWTGRLRVLTDAMTYSAAEDFLLGLQGLDHVTVAGTPTGGGSGRPRTIPLTAALNLTVSTALTYDRIGRCIEYHGVPVDITS